MRNFLIATKQAAVYIQSCKYKLVYLKIFHMSRVKNFKMQMQKPLVKRSFYCSAHVQDIIVVYLVPIVVQPQQWQRLLREIAGASPESGKIEVIFDIRFRLLCSTQYHYLWSNLMRRSNCVFLQNKSFGWPVC